MSLTVSARISKEGFLVTALKDTKKTTEHVSTWMSVIREPTLVVKMRPVQILKMGTFVYAKQVICYFL